MALIRCVIKSFQSSSEGTQVNENKFKKENKNTVRRKKEKEKNEWETTEKKEKVKNN